MTRYVPTITLAIPADIPTDRHPAITRAIDTANTRLARCDCPDRDAALDRAAIALSRSGAGACGIPRAIRESR